MAIQKKILKATVVSPIFSSGADNRKLELRTTEWKALMRTVFRWVLIEGDTEALYKKESDYFGGPSDDGHASPIRLQLTNIPKNNSNRESLVYRPSNRGVKVQAYATNTSFDIVLRKYLSRGKSLSWYENMLKLSVILSGVGKRSRRGRGVITVEGIPETKEKVLVWLTEQLNYLNEKIVYETSNQQIENISTHESFKRPIIEKIILGNEIKNIETYLSKVDQTAHKIKKCHKSPFLTGDAKGTSRFASSLIVSIVKTGNGKIYPIYTYLKPVKMGKVMCTKSDDRLKFFNKVEGKKGGE